MPISGDTVLRLICRRGIAPAPPPRVVGIDDWAWRRGRSYGTIVGDLERHRVFDLLPSRWAAPVRDWLARPSERERRQPVRSGRPLQPDRSSSVQSSQHDE
ncbi:transposase [Methylorubrum thiocyanatum]|uniref:transposase n=1 Tax=Methylorubrum thiocyanatum TaxID=47958 RepID=UPI003F810E03